MAAGTRTVCPARYEVSLVSDDLATFECSYLEQDVIEAPGLGGENGWHANFTFLNEVGEVDCTRAGISCSPGFA